MALTIGILGPLVIESDECQLGNIPKKARALLGYLAAQEAQPVSRERLADMLWSYQGSEQARHSLRNCLLELRKALGPIATRYLVTDFASCRIQDVVVDLDRFEKLSRSQHRSELQAAADSYRGEFLADFHIASEPFQEWVAAERDRTLTVVCDVLHRLTSEQDAAGEHDAAIQSGRRLVALDPLSELGQRALMRAYGRAGRRAEALRHYKSCAETLKRELGVAPDVETQALANEIARSSAARDLNGSGRAADDQDCAVFRTAPDWALESRPPRPEVPTSGTPKPQWPCLFPSIAVAVAPLRNLTGDADQQNLAEAFTDDLVTDLLRHGRGLSLKKLADERAATGKLPRAPEPERGYDYVVTGSAQSSAPGLLRVNMRITDAATSEYLWAGRHEFKPEDLALVQTRITRRISRELHALLLQAASRRAFMASDTELGVTECLSRAVSALQRGMRAEHSAEAQQWYLAALARDPRSVEALVGLAFTCQNLVSNPWWGDSRATVAASDLGREAVGIALSIAPGHADAHCVQGMLYSTAGQLDNAARAFEQALAMDQGLAIAHGFAGYNEAFLGRADKTLPAIERAMRLDPMDRWHSVWFFFGGFAELLLGRTEGSIALLRKSLERNRSYGSAQLFLMAALSVIGRRSEAAETATSFRAQYPDYQTNTFEQLWLSRSGSATYRAQIHPLFEKFQALGVSN
jgi:DNA-binding SARP family transcriptional activator/TolB-like protein